MYVLFAVTLYARAFRAAHMAEKERGWPISCIGRLLRQRDANQHRALGSHFVFTIA
jgi:hypothetical protein